MTKIEALEQHIAELKNQIRDLSKGSMRDNQLALLRNTLGIQTLYGSINTLKSEFKQLDNIQIKSLATETNLAKLLEQNNTTLGKMRGDFFENAEELLQNFSEGIRENTDESTALISRMKSTGQSIDSWRQATKALISTNIDSAGVQARFSAGVASLGKNFLISADRILDSVSRNSQLLDIPSIVGSNESVAEAISYLSAEIQARGGTEKQLAAVANLLLGTDQSSFSTRIALGIAEPLDRIMRPGVNVQNEIKTLLTQAADTAKKNFVVTNGSYKAFLTDSILSNIGNRDQLTSLIQVSNLMSKSLDSTRSMATAQDEYYKSAKVAFAEAKNFYKETMANVYPTITEYLPYLATGAAVGGLAGAIGSLGSLLGASGKIGMLLRFAGPIGAVAGTLISLLPMFMGDKKANEEKANSILSQSLDTQKKILEAQPNKKVAESVSKETMPKIIADSLHRIISLQSARNSESNSNAELLNTLNSLQKSIDKLASKQTMFKQ